MKCVNKQLKGWLLLSIGVIALDQMTKLFAYTHLELYKPRLVSSFFSLTLAFNTGAAFSFLSDSGTWHRWFLTGFSLVMSTVLLIWLMRTEARQKLQATALSLILGGAIGNLFDRIAYGYVIDFLDVHYQQYHWPIFNLADSAISLGAALLVIELWCNNRRVTRD